MTGTIAFQVRQKVKRDCYKHFSGLDDVFDYKQKAGRWTYPSACFLFIASFAAELK